MMRLVWGILAAGVMLVLHFFWFALADRYAVFLYFHDMGPLVPDTSPFSRVTASRYWMAGLVAGGLLTLVYTAVCWVWRRFRPDFTPPSWKQVWLYGMGLLLIGVPLIVMTANDPTLPLVNAMQVTAVSIIALGLATLPGKMAATRPFALFLLTIDGMGMAAVLMSVSLLERVQPYLERDIVYPLIVIIVGVVFGLGVLMGMTAVRRQRRWETPKVTALFLAGIIIAYLLLPTTHYLIGTDGQFYITDSDNFFARNFWLQIGAWLVMWETAVLLTRFRLFLHGRQFIPATNELTSLEQGDDQI